MELCLHPYTHVAITSLSASVIEGGRNNVVGIAAHSPRSLMYSRYWVFPGVKGPEHDSDHPILLALFANGLELYHRVLSLPAYAFSGLTFTFTIL